MNRLETTQSFTNMPLSLPDQLDQKIRYLFTDVDDTLTWQGKLPSQTLQALEQLHAASIQVVPVTGACAGWCDCMVRTWPVAAVIGENGAFWMQRNTQGHVETHYMLEKSIRQHQYQDLLTIQQQVLERHAFARATADQAYRETDIALDIHQQHFNTAEEIEILKGALLRAGLNARVSSIHINAWRGDYDKASTTLAWLRNQGVEGEHFLQQSAFIGDSANDAAMFDQLEITFGVANIRHCLNKLSTPPRYITQHEGGFGFVEVAALLLRNNRQLSDQKRSTL